MCDDLGWGDVGFNGGEIVQTPHLDALARRGLKFERFYAAAPVCSPTRGSCLTGRHPFRYGILSANVGHMPADELTLAEVLKAEGYATGHFGKWHLGTLTKRVKDANRGRPGNKHFAPPTTHGFKIFFSTESKVPTWDPLQKPIMFGPDQSLHYGWIPAGEQEHASRPYGTRYWHGPEEQVTEELEGDDSQVVMDRAVKFISAAAEAEQPFFAVIWFHTPHLPVVTGKQYRQRYADRPLREQLYYGCITAMDEQVGRLSRTLDALGVAENTMLWFASDNGPEVGTPGSAGPWRGRKRELYEGGVRVPAFLVWPQRVAAESETEVAACTSDYFPTVLDALERSTEPALQPLDGISLMPLLSRGTDERPRPIGFQHGSQAAWNDHRYKLIGQPKSGKFELYDLIKDPDEKHDIGHKQPKIAQRMQAELQACIDSCSASRKRPLR